MFIAFVFVSRFVAFFTLGNMSCAGHVTFLRVFVQGYMESDNIITLGTCTEEVRLY